MRGAYGAVVPQTVHPMSLMPPLPLVSPLFSTDPSSLSPLSPLTPPPPPQVQLTPLHLAARNKHEAACRVLIEAGAKVYALDGVSWDCVRNLSLRGVFDVCDSNGATAVFSGRLDRALGRLCVNRYRHRRQVISDTSNWVVSFSFGLVRC